MMRALLHDQLMVVTTKVMNCKIWFALMMHYKTGHQR